MEWQDDLRQLFLGYVEAKQAQEVLDYDDLLLYWAQMMSEPSLAGELGGRFSHVLVDEYQDTNRLQAAILLGLKPDGKGLTVVGDDAQSIYAFRGATIRNILDFPGRFPNLVKRVTLERNYRSTQPPPGGGQCRHFPSHRAFQQKPVERARFGTAPAAGFGTR